MKNKATIIIIITIIVISILVILKPQTYILKKIYKLDYSEYVYKYSDENKVDPLLIFAIIKNESNFKANIESHKGAIGLMQLMETTAKQMAEELGEDIVTKERLYNPEINIKIGTKYFAYLLKHYDGKESLAIAAYNAGIGTIDSWIKEKIIKKDGTDLENIPYKETNNHVRKILRDYRIYCKLYK